MQLTRDLAFRALEAQVRYATQSKATSVFQGEITTMRPFLGGKYYRVPAVKSLPLGEQHALPLTNSFRKYPFHGILDKVVSPGHPDILVLPPQRWRRRKLDL